MQMVWLQGRGYLAMNNVPVPVQAGTTSDEVMFPESDNTGASGFACTAGLPEAVDNAFQFTVEAFNRSSKFLPLQMLPATAFCKQPLIALSMTMMMTWTARHQTKSLLSISITTTLCIYLPTVFQCCCSMVIMQARTSMFQVCVHAWNFSM